jgi:hypothetical protein
MMTCDLLPCYLLLATQKRVAWGQVLTGNFFIQFDAKPWPFREGDVTLLDDLTDGLITQR